MGAGRLKLNTLLFSSITSHRLTNDCSDETTTYYLIWELKNIRGWKWKTFSLWSVLKVTYVSMLKTCLDIRYWCYIVGENFIFWHLLMKGNYQSGLQVLVGVSLGCEGKLFSYDSNRSGVHIYIFFLSDWLIKFLWRRKHSNHWDNLIKFPSKEVKL